ncbi:hypothetical protein DYB25_001445 [Aphanomyces astaci]|uniref:BED-type domain-containing protein n=1 Tax=Aphanomyces astaci TaxID=112090 RepID=A0A396ZSI3_APHAT|nr:hypothetical protein DYB25_001445 [Aphanomyces astaci]
MSKSGRPRTKIWDEFDDDAALAAKRYCRCKWCGVEVKADAARMYNHIVDSAVGIITSDMDEEGKDPCVYGSADVGGRHGGGKSKGGRPKDPIWDEFTTTDELRKRRYCMCVWCEKEVKGDTTRMTTHLVERCTEVDASTKAKYTVKHRKLDDDTSVDDHVLVALAPSTNVTMTSPQPNASREPISPVVGMTREVVSPSREAASAVDVAALGPFPPPSPPLPHPSYPAPRQLEPPGRPDTMQQQQHAAMLSELGLQDINPGVFGGGTWFGHGPMMTVINPSTNQAIASVRSGTAKEYMHVVQSMDKAAPSWRQATAAHRSRVVRHIGDVFRSHHQRLANVLALESGIVQRDAMTLVASMIRRCDDAAAAVIVHSVTASTIATVHDCAESRPLNTMQIVQLERFGPLGGHVGLLTPAHSPTWTGAMALACGNAVLWKPSLSLIAIAITRLIASVLRSHGYPPACASLICGSGADVGACLARDKRMAVVCYQGSAVQSFSNAVNAAMSYGQVDTHLPITFISKFQSLEQVLDQRLVLFTQSPMEAALCYTGANVVGVNCELPSGGDAFGSWNDFVRRTTCTVNMTHDHHQHKHQSVGDPTSPIATSNKVHIV